jgi:serine/threonine-protein kinase RsbW
MRVVACSCPVLARAPLEERSAQPDRSEGGSMATKTGEKIRLTVPAALEYVRIVRLTASGVASRLGFDVEEVEDLRVAVDELASLAVETGDGNDLDVEFAVYDDALHIVGTVGHDESSKLEARVDELTASILTAVVDDWEFGPHDGAVRFRCTRRIPTS